MAYFDVRPSAHAPTLELRVCDACPLVDDAVLIAGLFRAMVRAAEHEIEAGRALRPGPRPAAPRRDLAGGPQRAVRQAARRQPAPRAAARGRGGPDAGRPAAAAARGARRLGRGRPSWPRPRSPAATPPTGSAPRSPSGAGSTTWSTGGRTRPTVRPADRCPPMPALRHYRSRAGDEAVGPGPSAAPGLPRHRRALPRAVEPRTWRQRRGAPRPVGRARPGSPSASSGEKRRFSVDLVPRVLGPHEWESSGRRADPAGPGHRVVPAGRLRRPADPDRRACSPRSWSSGRPAGGRGDPAAGGHRPGAGHGLRPGPQRVRRLAGAGGQRPQPQRGRVRHRHPRPDGRGAAGPAPAGRPAGPGRRPCRDCARACSPTPSPDPRGAAVQRPGTARPGSSTGCWPSGAGCCWSWPTTSTVRDGGSGTAAAGDPIGVLYLRLDDELVDLATTRPAPDRRRDLRRRRGRWGASWPTPRATGSPTTRRCTASCPS